MNHTQARQLIQAAADGLLSDSNRRSLERHLATCQQCQAYSNDLNNLEASLSYSLQTRWQEVQPRRFSLDQASRAAAASRRSPGLTRLYQLVAVPAFQFGALAVLAVALALLIGARAAAPTGQNGSQTPSPTFTAQSSAAPGLCTAVASIDAKVYRDHDAASEVIGALPHGQTSPVHVYYIDAVTNQVWLQIDYNGGLGWVTNPDTLLGGDCSQVLTEEPSKPVEPTSMQSPTGTPVPATLPPVVATQQVCNLVAPSPQTLYADASLGAPVVGTLNAGQPAPILAWAHNGQPPAWFLVRVGSVTGWVWATWVDPAAGAPCAGIPLTAWPTQQPSPTATITPVGCVVAPSDDPSSDHRVFSGPATTYPVIGTLTTGSYVTATGLFSQDNYDAWIRITFNGQDGWMPGGYLMFAGGGCWPLPVVDFTPHPPTFTPAPTLTPTPVGTADAPLAFETSVSGDVGTTQQFSAAFPWQSNSNPSHQLSITVTGIPPGDTNASRRIVDFTLTCSGTGSGSLTWGWAINPGTFHCGETTRSNGLLWSYNTVQFLIDAPLSGSDTVNYVMTISVSAYPG